MDIWTSLGLHCGSPSDRSERVHISDVLTGEAGSKIPTSHR